MTGNIKATIARKLAQPGAYSEEILTSVAAGFVAALEPWLRTQMVGPVLGKGPFQRLPPPVGPVVGGDIEAPPHFGS
jgi:hypothetical protein